MRTAFLLLLLVQSVTAICQQKTGGIALAVEPRVGIIFRIPEPTLGTSVIGGLNVKFNRFHSLVTGADFIYVKSSTIYEGPGGRAGGTNFGPLQIFYFNVPLNYRVYIGKNKFQGFFETGIGAGLMQLKYRQVSYLMNRVTFEGSGKHMQFNFEFNTVLGFKYAVTPVIDVLVSGGIYYQSGNPAKYLVLREKPESFFPGVHLGASYTFKTFERKKKVEPK